MCRKENNKLYLRETNVVEGATPNSELNYDGVMIKIVNRGNRAAWINHQDVLQPGEEKSYEDNMGIGIVLNLNITFIDPAIETRANPPHVLEGGVLLVEEFYRHGQHQNQP